MIRSPVNKPHPESLKIGALLTVLVALGQISMSLYIPSMPALVDAMATTQARVNLTLAMFLLGFAVFQLVYGPLSDRFGRRPVLLGALVLYTVASAACALSPTIDTLIAARFVQGVGACAGQVIGRAVVRDVYGRERAARAMAYIGAALAVSPAITPVLGGVMEVWLGWQSVFVLTAVLGVVVFAAAWAMLAETNADPDASAARIGVIARNFVALLKSPIYLGNAAAVAGMFGGLMAFTAAAPFVFISGLGLAPHEFGMLSVFNVAGFFVGSLIAGRYALRVGPERMVLGGISVAVLGASLMAAFAVAGVVTIPAIIGPMMVVLVGLGPVMSGGMAGAMAPFPRMAGAASGMVGFLQMSTAAAVSAMVGHLDNTTQGPMAAALLALAASALAVFTATAYRLGKMARTD